MFNILKRPSKFEVMLRAELFAKKFEQAYKLSKHIEMLRK